MRFYKKCLQVFRLKAIAFSKGAIEAFRILNFTFLHFWNANAKSPNLN